MALSFSFPSVKNGELIEQVEVDSSERKQQLLPSFGPISNKQWSSVPSLTSLENDKNNTNLIAFITPSSGTRPASTTIAAPGRVETVASPTSNKSEGLPDVTETESPNKASNYYPFPSEKPCDLLAQLEQSNSKVKNQKQDEAEDAKKDKSVVVPLQLSFDDNGNPLHPNFPITPVSVPVEENSNFPVPEKEKSPETEPGKDPDDNNYVDGEAEEDLVPGEIRGEITVSSSSTGNDTIDLALAVEEEDNQPKYFINAAALSEELFPISPTPSYSSMEYQNILNQPDVPEETTPEQKQPEPKDSEKDDDKVFIRHRVPVSKSFPDIVQTTFNNDDNKESPIIMMNMLTKDNSDLDSLVADSLENLASLESQTSQIPSETSEEPRKGHSNISNIPKPINNSSKVFEKAPTTLNKTELELLTESQQGGIFAEKPPEAWVIDFNSLSLESEYMDTSEASTTNNTRRSNPSSNPSSLAFFVNIDDKAAATASTSSADKEIGLEKPENTTPEKKIFSMFVDFGGKDSSSSADEQNQNMSSSMIGKKPLVNKTVMNVIEDRMGSGGKGSLSASSSSLSRKFPSPIFQHKAAAEQARKAARLELLEKERADKIGQGDVMLLSTTSTATSGGDFIGNKGAIGLGMDCCSNRSSLHVANESSFSSSLLSSMENSAPTEMEICQGGPCFKLGKDLLRMFQEGINTDVNITVNGRYVKAHKCILASRSQYFAAILSGHWVEKAGNTINLDGFSYNVVQFTMYHIYSGTNEIPDTIDLLELATLTDLLGLEGLRENISQTIRVKFCHNFHRPCTGCISGVLECFPIALAYGMDELNRKMTKWICKHFVRIWPTKAFASLGDELIEKCLRYSVNHLSGDNILDHTLGCDQLLTTMPTVRWTEAIFSIVSQLSEACVQFIGENFCQVLQSQRFLLFGKGQTWNISRIEGTFTEAMILLKPDEACLTHTALCRLIELGTETIDEVEWSTMFVDFLKLLRQEVERYLLANASKAVLSKYWEQLSQDIRKKICTSSFMGYDKFGNKITKNPNTGSAGGHGAAASKSSHSRERPLSSTAASRNNAGFATSSSRAVTKQSSATSSTLSPGLNKDKHGQSHGHGNTATKVASVRPMQTQQHQNVFTTSTLPKNTTNLANTAGNTKLQPGKTPSNTLGPKSTYNSASPRTTVQPSKPLGSLRPPIEREKSFNSTRNTLATTSSSANRTPLKPLTPMTPSKPSPLIGTLPSKTARNPAHGKISNPSHAAAQGQKTFMTNSARAAAVSKANLRTPAIGAKSKSSSSSSSVQHTPRTPNLAQPSRYGSSLAPGRSGSCGSGGGSGGYSARSSFSSSERPERITAAAKSKAAANTSAGSNYAKRNTYGHGHTTIPTANKNIYGSSAPKQTRFTSGTVGGSSTSKATSTTTTAPYSGGNDIYAKDNIMSRSTIETDSGETKIRTLAEIGRSSTFSKDEPTILGKMDGSTYGMEISP